MEKTNWKKYLEKPYHCSCGKTHVCSIEDIIIEENAIERLPEILGKHDYKKLCVVSDINTQEVAGEKVCAVLDKTAIPYQTIVFQDKELVPDEEAVTYFLTEIDRDCDLIIGVGSGTINDLCRFISFKMNLDYYIVGTAPSMDGYASNVSPLIIKHLKTTYEAHTAKVIIGDLDILAQAPLSMIAAGAGDILGKYVCLTDWQLAHIINGEYYCPEMAAMVRESIQKVVDHAERAAKREKEAVAAIMEGLVLSGIVMSYIGNSRPASGSEHHMSHYWEMMFLLDRQPDPLHGTKVGIGTVAAIKMYEKLRELGKDAVPGSAPHFDYNTWSQEIETAYGPAVPGVLKLEQSIGKNKNEEVTRRRAAYLQHLDKIQVLIDELPKAETIIDILKSMDAPYYPEQIKVTKDVFKRSIYYAKDLRNRFGLLQLLFDLELQEGFSNDLIKEIYKA